MSTVRKTLPLQVARPLRAALYLRVSTGRQAEGDVSLPSQRDLTTRHCDREGWIVADEYVEPGLSATDDRRPAFQAMLERACVVLEEMVGLLRKGMALETTKELNDKLQAIEAEADRLILELYRDTYTKETDPMRYLILKDLFEILEKAIDRCRDAGNVIYGVVLKNA